MRGLYFEEFEIGKVYEHAIRRNEGLLAAEGPLVCRTGQHTGRSPNDKFIVKEASSEKHVHWGNVNKPIEENNLRAVRLLEPTLKVWDVPFARIESAQDLPQLRVLWDQAWTNKGPTAALVGAPTS